MANGQTQDPLQGFIEQFMTMRQFTEQQRQFGAQQALAQRQVDNAEIQQFASLAPFVEQPEQRQALAQQFAMRMPHMAPTFMALAQTIPVSEQVYKHRKLLEGLPEVDAGQVASVALTGMDQGAAATSSVQAGRAPEDILLGIRTGEGQELTAGQQQQGNQFQQNLTETTRRFGIEADQRDRSLGIQEFIAAQQGELGRMSTLFGAGFGGMTLRADRSRALREVQEKLQNPSLTPEDRRALQEQEAEISDTIATLTAMEAGAEGAAGGMRLNQLIEAEGQAYDDMIAATSPGEKEVATQRFNFIRSMLYGKEASLIEQDFSGFRGFGQKLLGMPGSSATIPYDSAAAALPFLRAGGAQ